MPEGRFDSPLRAFAVCGRARQASHGLPKGLEAASDRNRAHAHVVVPLVLVWVNG